MFGPQDIRPKDFAFLKKDGVYHLFYIRHNDVLPPFATENDFGHAISTDLYHWTQLAPVLAVDPHGWDNLHVWAPSIIQAGGFYWMFYTGVTDSPGFAATQRIGVAISSDLMTWNRVGSPVWQTSSSPWAWWQPANTLMSCRDPFVMPDPRAPGQFLLYYTATPALDTLSNVVGVARCPSGDLTTWVDEKPLWITYKSYSFNPSTESPHLFSHNGQWYLFMTTGSGQPLSFFVGPDPLGEPAQWVYRGRLRTMLGYDTSLWFASEYLKDGNTEYFAFCNDTHIEFHTMAWDPAGNFSLAEPSLYHVVSLSWSRPSIREYDPVGLRIRTANGFSRDKGLVAFVQNANGTEIAAPIDSLGLSSNPVLTGDSTVVQWFPRRWPCTLAASQPMRVRVAAEDGSATSDWLSVFANSRTASAAPRPGGTAPDPNPPAPPPITTLQPDTLFGFHQAPAPEAFSLRALPSTPLGAGPAIAFVLPEAADARVDVFDLQGRRLVTLADRRFPAGAQVLPWDGRDGAGVRLARGLYFARIVTPARTATTRVLLEP